ncbi:hypothetical protein [Woodsholea maritima]|uniref:hypothetical protein n=1 Tax=Woodsholea maritima TaxID=240237 RepID=UPI000382C688|nr:hypothetical protein [Woodsholea maritima]
MQTMNNGRGQKDFLAEASNWFSAIGSVVITFFATPFAYGSSVEAVQAFARDHYGFDFGIGILWWLLTVAVIGLTSTVILKLLLSGGTVRYFRNLLR